ncbi:MAG: cytochrome b5 [Elusimicrobia bacterium]|nr:MAG: cytochrome b5 [Elusimicrobiota bacterium]KAF0152988.1 MAG: cytochrome b5 [Elusimicrobiota bacterium]
MKKILAMAVLALLAGGVSAADKPAETKAEDWKEKVFTAEELKKFDGKKGQPVYVAVDGVVYDLSGVKYWKGGSHMNMHEAGEDLSDDIKNRAPEAIHKKGEILKRYPKVGVLAPPEAKDEAEKPVVTVPDESELGLEKFCPVMEHSFVVEAKTPVVLYKGGRYFMCCPAGPPLFAKDPEKYINNPKVRAEKKKEALERERLERAEKRKKKKSKK